MAGYMNPDDATIGAPKRKKLSIGAPKGRDIFASHWSDVGQGDGDPEGDALSYAKSFHQALNNAPSRQTMIKPIDPFAVMQSGLLEGGEVPGIHQGMGKPVSPVLKAIQQMSSQAPITGPLPEQAFGGMLRGGELGDEMLPESRSPLTALNIQSNPLPEKKGGKFAAIGGALKRAILGR